MVEKTLLIKHTGHIIKRNMYQDKLICFVMHDIYTISYIVKKFLGNI